MNARVTPNLMCLLTLSNATPARAESELGVNIMPVTRLIKFVFS
jgi:hypothetical protein